MTLGPLMLDIDAESLSPEDRELLAHPLVGGVILFRRNFADREQLASLCDEIHRLRHPPLLIAVDQEGGRVQRFENGYTKLPAIRSLGQLWDIDKDEALTAATEMGWLMAAELRADGVDFSFAPVLDLDWGVSTVIGDRAFARDPDTVTQLARRYIKGMREAGMAAIGKHFPGHGAVAADSHHALPRDRRDYGELLEDLLPFRKLVSNGLDGIMTAHVVYTELDLQPASFSEYWIRHELRENLGFGGVVFSDDLSMEGAAGIGDMPMRARTALEAGSDMILVCNDREAAVSVVDTFGDYVNPPAALRLTKMHGGETIQGDELRTVSRWQEAVATVDKISGQPGLTLDA